MSMVFIRPDLSSLVAAILAERSRQDEMKAAGRFDKTCADNLSNAERFAILGEEVGEVARAVLEGNGMESPLAHDNHGTELRKELVQVAAVCLAWLEGLERE